MYLCKLKSEDSVAQQVEHIPFKDGVLGSNPSWITGKRAIIALFLFHLSAKAIPKNTKNNKKTTVVLLFYHFVIYL